MVLYAHNYKLNKIGIDMEKYKKIKDKQNLYSVALVIFYPGFALFEKYLNSEGFLEKSLKIKSALKSTGKSLKNLQKSLNSTISVGLSTVERDRNQYNFVVPLFGAAYAAPNIGTKILY